MDFEKMTIKEAGMALREGKITALELAMHFVSVARKVNESHNIFLEIYDDDAIAVEAERAQKMIDEGRAVPLTGIPVAIKDNILIEGRRVSASSKILENYIATYTATASKKLIEAGVIIIGRTNMDEFAMGSSTENSAFGVTKNAYDSGRVAGGSSGGSAVAVALGTCLGTLGSDTGGSIRQPASLNGVVGLKPTYGSVSRNGLIAMASSLDVIGPIARTVEDAKTIFETIKGVDSLDSTTVEKKTPTPSESGVKKIGIPRNFLREGIDEDVLNNFDLSLKKLEALGYQIEEISLPSLDYSLAVYYVLQPAEVSSNMARYDGIKFGGSIEGENLIDGYFKTRGELLGREVRRRIMLGTYVLSTGYADEYYYRALAVRRMIREEVLRALEGVDLIALPTTPSPAFKIGEKTSDPVQMYLEDVFTVSANLVGIPAISIPNGMVEREGVSLPTGLQLMAGNLDEEKIFEVAEKFEKISK